MCGHILAFEGPAGSGKGFHIDKLRASPEYGGNEDVVFLERPKLARNLGPQVGAWSSSYLEYQAVSAAVMMPTRTFVVDRFLLSRWVYKAFEEFSGLDRDFVTNLQCGWYSMVELACAESDRRIGPATFEEHGWSPQAHIKVLLPSLDQLCWNRLQSGRQYPFNPQKELYLYREAALRTQDALWMDLTIELVEF